MKKKKKILSPINLNQKIDYKDIDLLILFVTEQGKFFHAVLRELQFNNKEN